MQISKPGWGVDNSLEEDRDFESIQEYTGSMLENRALYEALSRNPQNTLALLDIIRNTFPEYPLTMDWNSILSELNAN